MKTDAVLPSRLCLPSRILGVWSRHMRVYVKNFLSNAFPPLLEPLIFLGGIGIGLGVYIQFMDGMPYVLFLAAGLLVTPAMFTASFECTFGTFIRLEFDKVYDGMLAAPLTYRDIVFGEILWAGTKGLVFSSSVLLVVFLAGIVRNPLSLLTPFVGFLTGLMFAALALLVTSFVKTINDFNFYFTGFLSPLFFFSGVVFPLSNLPGPLQVVAEFVPLTHPVRLARALCSGQLLPVNAWDLFYMIVIIIIMSALAAARLKRRLVL